MDKCRFVSMKFSDECIESPESVYRHAMAGKCHECQCDLNGIAGERTQDLIYQVSIGRSVKVINRMPGMFSLFGQTERHGKDWIRRMPPNARVTFSFIGRIYSVFGKAGGLHRALFGKRGPNGRFIKES